MAKWFMNAGCPQPCRAPIYPCLIVADFQESQWDVLSGSGYSFSGGALTVAQGGSFVGRCNVVPEIEIGRNVAIYIELDGLTSASINDLFFKLWTNANAGLTSGYYMQRGAGETNLIAGDADNEYVFEFAGQQLASQHYLGANDGNDIDVRVPNVNAVSDIDGILGQWGRPALTWINPAPIAGMYIGLEVQAINTPVTVKPQSPFPPDGIVYQTRNPSGPDCPVLIGTAGCYDPVQGIPFAGICKEFTIPSAYNLTIPVPFGGGSGCCEAYTGDYILTPDTGSSFPCAYTWVGSVPGGCGGGDFQIDMRWRGGSRVEMVWYDPLGSWTTTFQSDDVNPGGQELLSCLDLVISGFSSTGSFGDCFLTVWPPDEIILTPIP